MATAPVDSSMSLLRQVDSRPAVATAARVTCEVPTTCLNLTIVSQGRHLLTHLWGDFMAIKDDCEVNPYVSCM